MNATLSSVPRGVFNTQSSYGVGKDALKVEETISEVQKWLLTSFSIGKPKCDALESLYETFEESCKPDWDGYSASAVTYEAYMKAKQFLDRFPTSLPAPEVSVDPDGEVSFEWYASARRVFSVSIGTNDEVTYAGIFGASKTHGVEVFHDEIPRIVFDNIRRVYSN